MRIEQIRGEVVPVEQWEYPGEVWIRGHVDLPEARVAAREWWEDNCYPPTPSVAAVEHLWGRWGKPGPGDCLDEDDDVWRYRPDRKPGWAAVTRVELADP